MMFKFFFIIPITLGQFLFNIFLFTNNVKAITLDKMNPTTAEFNNAKVTDIELGERMRAHGGLYTYNVTHFVPEIGGAYNFDFIGTTTGPIAKIYEKENTLFFYKRVLRAEGEGQVKKYTYPGQTIFVYSDFRIELDLDKGEDYYLVHSSKMNAYGYDYTVTINKDKAKMQNYVIWTQDDKYRNSDQINNRTVKHFSKEALPIYYFFLEQMMSEYVNEYVQNYEINASTQYLFDLMYQTLGFYITSAIPGLDLLVFIKDILLTKKEPNKAKTDLLTINILKRDAIMRKSKGSQNADSNKLITEFNEGIYEDSYSTREEHHYIIDTITDDYAYGVYGQRGTFVTK